MALTGGRYVRVGSGWLKESREMRMTGKGSGRRVGNGGKEEEE